ncbi:helix-turn-helix domain-containing protein [Nocardia flavorosea]|uniref:Helix-turn-helix domain-containing protein n=1 Tax=Nocardia flavorosea TaxID=53429 RepID=A0A846YCT2_9NOCA|nr:helix-turn-helix transcriptional regulator [Nocardia flavorosea]NKY55572.1 helix-turn-helix domain-containing protein [Nocardia flavorosea]
MVKLNFHHGAFHIETIQLARVTIVGSGSMLPRRALGRQLRKMRLREGITQASAARAAEVSPQSYGRLEDGLKTKITDLAMNALCNAFSSSDVERRTILDLAQEVRQSQGADGGWWQAYAEVVPETFNHFIGLEESAMHIASWEVALFPGLLQTREYRRALIWAEYPDMPPENVELTLDIVMRRQEILERSDFHFEAMIAEPILHTPVGGPAVSADQLSHLLAVSRLPSVTMRIVKRDARDLLGLITGSFVVFDLPPLPVSRMRQPSVAYAEGYFGRVYIEGDAKVALYRRAVERLRRVACSPDESRDLVLEARKEWEQ